MTVGGTPRDRTEQIERETLSSRAVLAADTKGREREEPAAPAPDRVPAGPRPHPALQGLPPAEAQDPGVPGAGGRPLPGPAHPHAGGGADRPHRRPGAAPQRGPDRGHRARPRPGPHALRPPRRGGPLAVPRPARSVTTSRACASSTTWRTTAAGSTSRGRSATASSTTPGRCRCPSTLEAQVVRFSDRIAYVNHDVDDAVRAGVLRPEDLPADVIGVLGETHSRSRRHASSATSSTESWDGERSGCPSPCFAAMTALRELPLRARLPARGGAPRSTRRPSAWSGRCSRTTLITRSRSRPSTWPRPATWPHHVADYIAGMTDRFALRTYEQLFLPQGWLL